MTELKPFAPHDVATRDADNQECGECTTVALDWALRHSTVFVSGLGVTTGFSSEREYRNLKIST